MTTVSNRPRVSVIIPTHNRHQFLSSALDSVARQTHQNLEVIVVDDASDEDIQAVVLSTQWSETTAIQYLRSDTNLGPGAARELGRKQATGEFIAYLDSDDIWHPEKIETQIQTLLQNPEAGMSYCTSTEFERLPITGMEPVRKQSDQQFHSFLPTVLYGRPWGTSACLWTRESADRIGPWYSGWTWEDYEYDCRAGCKGIKIVFVSRILCHYRRDSNGQHLSMRTDLAQKSRYRALALLKMTNELRLHGKLRDPAVRGRVVSLVYSQAVSLLRHQEKALAVECLDLVRRTSIHSQNRILAVGLKATVFVFPASLVARIAARLRRLVIGEAWESA